MLLVFGAPCQRNLLAGQEHGRTIPLPDCGGLPVRRIQAAYMEPERKHLYNSVLLPGIALQVSGS